MDLSLTEKTSLQEDHTWVADPTGLQTMRTITLDGTACGDPADGIVKSGTPIGLISGGNTYGLYDNTDPAVCAGFLGQTVKVTDDNGTQVEAIGAVLFWEGGVIEAELPTAFTGLGSTPKSAAKTDVAGFIKFF